MCECDGGTRCVSVMVGQGVYAMVGQGVLSMIMRGKVCEREGKG